MPSRPRQRPESSAPLAGFQTSITGRFCPFTEGNAAGSDATPNNTTRHPSAKENAGPSLASAVEAVIERSEDRVVIDVARIKARALMPQEREALIDLLEDLLILARSA